MNKYLLISFFIHSFLMLCLVILNVGQDHIVLENDKTVMSIDIIPTTYKKSMAKSLKEKVSKTKKISKILKIKSIEKNNDITAQKVNKIEVSEVNQEIQTAETVKQVKQAQLSYVQKLKLYIEKNKYYPRQAVRLRQSGTVTLRLKISKAGVFSSIEVLGSSDFPILDEAALKLIKKIGRFNPLPSNIKQGSYFTVPIAYNLRR